MAPKDGDARRRILDRRARFVAAALSSVAFGCDRPAACLDVAKPVGHEEKDASAATPDATAPDATAGATDTEPSGAVPCLAPPPYDAGTPDAAPVPCLRKMTPTVDAGPGDGGPKPCLLL